VASAALKVALVLGTLSPGPDAAASDSAALSATISHAEGVLSTASRYAPVSRHAVRPRVCVPGINALPGAILSGKIRFIRAQTLTDFPADPSAVWGRLAGKFEVETVPGDHLGIMSTHYEALIGDHPLYARSSWLRVGDSFWCSHPLGCSLLGLEQLLHGHALVDMPLRRAHLRHTTP